MPVNLFPVRTFDNLASLTSITKDQIDVHLKLYAGYVNNTNTLREKIAALVKSGNAGTPEYGELVRRLGWEYNGMRLHELYFENLTANGGEHTTAPILLRKIEAEFDGWENFKTHWNKVAAMRGVGWNILYQDPATKNLSVHWISSHEEGHPAGFKPILVMDIWEHAWSVYLKPTERAKYIEDFWTNIAWKVAQDRLL